MTTTDRTGLGSACNVGGIDRKLRGLAGTLLVVGGVAAFASGAGTAGAVATLAGTGLLFNAVTGFCVINALLGIDTCS